MMALTAFCSTTCDWPIITPEKHLFSNNLKPAIFLQIQKSVSANPLTMTKQDFVFTLGLLRIFQKQFHWSFYDCSFKRYEAKKIWYFFSLIPLHFSK